MLNKLHFHTRVFIFYSLLASVIIITLSSAFYLYIFSYVKQDSRQYFIQTVDTVAMNIDRLTEGLDAMSTQLIASEELQSLSRNIKNSIKSNPGYLNTNLEEKRGLQAIFLSINSPVDKVRKISLFFTSRDFVSIGGHIVEYKDGLPEPVYSRWNSFFETQELYFKILPPTEAGEDGMFSSPLTFSLIRPVLDTYSNFKTLGILELQQDYSKIEQICSIYDEKNEYELYIIDGTDVIYPLNVDENKKLSLYSNYIENHSPREIFAYDNEMTRRKEIICYSTLEHSSWNVILVQPRSAFMKPIHNILKLVLLLCSLFMILTIIVIFVITRSLTRPIKELRESVKRVSFENPSIDVLSHHDEIEELKDTFNEMILQLQESAHKIIHSRSSELNAHFLALQAQINPHFLYNSIMSISAAGQEDGSRKVQTMCSQLGDLFRYIASTDEYRDIPVTVQDEIIHAENYLDFMKWRYEDRLEFSIDFPESMLMIPVPKLILQPVLENSISHGFKRVRPPIRLSVKGRLNNKRWSIVIADNGGGFDNESLDNLKKQMQMIDKSILDGEFKNDFKIGGMALVNIYSRLKLQYEDNALLHIENPAEGGAQIIIGGAVQLNHNPDNREE
ncbi:MAG: histidine kinase [Spirochaetales bacterium]|nr:histidine kinase [Spirochaetales bacterium]